MTRMGHTSLLVFSLPPEEEGRTLPLGDLLASWGLPVGSEEISERVGIWPRLGVSRVKLLWAEGDQVRGGRGGAHSGSGEVSTPVPLPAGDMSSVKRMGHRMATQAQHLSLAAGRVLKPQAAFPCPHPTLLVGFPREIGECKRPLGLFATPSSPLSPGPA